jgi:tRNA A-37 threonylcarbamoyl transferase component Bud32
MDLSAFRPGSRFEVLRTLAHGAMGIVHEAFDRKRNARVAVKVLYRVNAEGILRLKREFRALQGVVHPNLVTPIELLEENGHWYIVMELVDGIDLLTYVRPGDVGAEECDEDSTVTLDRSRLERSVSPQKTHGVPGFDEGRLRDALRQLVAGLAALHGARRVHRDIKPSNVLVRPDGRVMILDFGLVAETDSSFSQEYSLGTVAYMAPEQNEPGMPMPAADWYSVGVVLYEALTGQRPWNGSILQVLDQKRSGSLTPPSALARVPPDLDTLCVDLLRPDPSARPGAEAIAARLGQGAMISSGSRADAPVFVGRESELCTLRRAFDNTTAGRPSTVLVTGESGVGKSTLVAQFLAQFRAEHPGAVILRGRCHESESVPYKALDGVIDSLCHVLRSLPPTEAAGLVPVRAVLLTQAFPVLGRVDAMARAPRTGGEVLDPQERLNRMSAALRELFVRLCQRYPVVVAIDDMQWADADSMRLYRDLMRPPDAPALLLIATMLGDEQAQTLGAPEGEYIAGETRSLHLLRLPPAEARRLTSRLLGEDDSSNDPSADAIAADAAGHPLFIGELVRYSRSLGGHRHASAAIRLEEAIGARVALLAPTHRELLEVITIAGRPIEEGHARLASGLEPEEMGRAVAALRANSLIEHTNARGLGTKLDVYHNRVRIAVMASLDPARQQRYHRALATTMMSAGDPESLAMHWLGAGDREQAASHARQAADQAMDTLAFARAAQLYRMVLELGAPTGADATAIKTRLGDALTNAGRGAEAARAYIDATAGAPEPVALELQSRAAGQFLRSGQFPDGMSTLRRVLAAARFPIADTPRGVLASLVLRYAQLRFRGLRFTERAQCDIDAQQLMVIDTCWSAAMALSMVDTVRGWDFQVRYLLLALRAGEPCRIARGLALLSTLSTASGVRASAKTARLLARAEALAEKTQDGHALGMCRLCRGAAAYLEGNWPQAFAMCAQAEDMFRDRCSGVAWESATARVFGLWSMTYLGELGEMNARLPHLVMAAEARGDLYEATTLRVGHSNLGWLALDDPDRARADVVEAMQRWTVDGLNVQQFHEAYSLAQIDLYCGRGRAAYERTTRDFPRLAGSWLWRIPVIRIEMKFLRARAALAAAVEGPGRPFVRIAKATARSIARERASWSHGLASLLAAQIADLAGDREQAAHDLRSAIEQFQAASMSLHATIAGRRLGETIGGDKGAEMIIATDAWMQQHGVINAERMAGLVAPFPGRGVSARPSSPWAEQRPTERDKGRSDPRPEASTTRGAR